MPESKLASYVRVLEFKRVGRDGEEHYETIDPLIEGFWHKAPSALNQREYKHNGCTIRVDINWQRLANRIRRDNELLRPVRTGARSDNDWFRKISRPLKLQAEVTVSGTNDTASYQWYPAFFVEMFVHEVFLIANLAVPGSANFYTLSIAGAEERHPTEMGLSAFVFENGWVDSLNGEWPRFQTIPREEVCEWFRALEIGYKQRADTGIEKALYVLLHIAKDNTRIDSITWIFHGLEALVSTRVGESVSGLVRRLGEILEMDATMQKNLNKRLRQLYDLRSSFVHGGYAVPHPIASEVIDRSLDGHMRNLYELNQFGAALLIATLQALIKKRIVKLEFHEQIMATTI
ncbi:hypothetical protein [Cupriavidus oxalaticus]|uniref:hypothetical protein n=1 Tax=Cupriavidus oxalaticus TaxID=96344 RepID=UPI00316CF54C